MFIKRYYKCQKKTDQKIFLLCIWYSEGYYLSYRENFYKMTRRENNSDCKNGQDWDEEIYWREIQIVNKNVEISFTLLGKWKLKHQWGTIFTIILAEIKKLWRNRHSYPVGGTLLPTLFGKIIWQYLLKLKIINHLP